MPGESKTSSQAQKSGRNPSTKNTGNITVWGFSNHRAGSIFIVVPVILLAVISGMLLGSGQKPGPGTVMFLTGLLTVALVFFAFVVFMNRIPSAFATLESRGIIVPDTGKETPPDPATVQNPTMAPHRTEEFQEFLNDTLLMMNSRLQWVAGEAFMILPLVWFVPITPGPLIENYGKVGQLGIEMFIAFLIGLIAWRMIVMGLQIRSIPDRFILQLQPIHPDRCGGLSPLGNLCLGNALIIALPGMYLGGWMAIGPAIGYTAISAAYSPTFTWLLLIPIIFSVITFIIPLWETHQVMVVKKAEILYNLDELVESMNRKNLELLTVPENPDAVEGTTRIQNLEEMQTRIEALEKIYTRHQNISDWPFNTSILAKFISSQAIPVLTLVGVGEPVAGILASLVGYLVPGS